MIYPVKILDQNGKVKQIISSSSLTDKYWKEFYDEEESIGLMSGPRAKKIPESVRRQMDLQFPGLNETSTFLPFI
ncbi:MAG: hypothetical protein ACE5ER_08755 [Nitrospinaceae bacterium]